MMMLNASENREAPTGAAAGMAVVAIVVGLFWGVIGLVLGARLF